jgi:beta-galactosidase
MHRLERLLHAFGPISAAAFDIMGLGAYDSCLEQGPFAEALFQAESFLRKLLAALSAQGVAYRLSGNDSAAHALAASRCGFVVSAFGLEAELWDVAQDAARRGVDVRFGPSFPTTTPDARTQLAPLSSESASVRAVNETELDAELAALSARHAPFRLAPAAGFRASLFRDRGGAPRVLFVTNTTSEAGVARLEIGAQSPSAGISEAVDALDGAVFRATFGALEVPLSPQSVRMLELK